MQALTINSEPFKPVASEHPQESDELLLHGSLVWSPLLGPLFERHHVSLYQFCLQLTRNKTMSENLAQEVLIKVLNKAKSFRGEGSFKAWLFNIARNQTGHPRHDWPFRAGFFYLVEAAGIEAQNGRIVVLHSACCPKGEAHGCVE